MKMLRKFSIALLLSTGVLCAMEQQAFPIQQREAEKKWLGQAIVASEQQIKKLRKEEKQGYDLGQNNVGETSSDLADKEEVRLQYLQKTLHYYDEPPAACPCHDTCVHRTAGKGRSSGLSA